MQQWMLFALLSATIYPIVNFTDKYILAKYIQDYRGMVIFGALASSVTGTFIWIFAGFPTIPFIDAVFVMSTGILAAFASAIYFHVVQKEETSKVILLFQLIPAFILILSTFFLKETLVPRQLLGFLLLLLAALGIVAEGDIRSVFKVDKVLILMIFADLFWAVGSILFDFAVDTGEFSKIIAFESWGWALGGFVLFVAFPSVRKAFLNTTKTLKKPALGFVFGNEFVLIFSKLSLFMAISLGPVALVSAVDSTGAFFGIFYGWLLTLMAPKIFDENITRLGIIQKSFWALVMFLGLLLL